MLERSFPLSGGARVRLRLARPRDFRAVTALLASAGAGGELEALRLVRFDPRCQAVVCATLLEDGVERLLAIGAIELPGQEPAVVLAAPGQGPEVAELVERALAHSAAAHAAHHAA